MSYVGTPAAERAERAVLQRYGPLVTKVGQYNRRPIAGTTTWSQHSWGNALDFHVRNKAHGDQIADWLRANAKALGVRTTLWWVRSHYDHIHVDFWPRGLWTPPLTGNGIGWFQYSSLVKIKKAQIQVIEPQGPGVVEDEDEMITKWLDEEGFRQLYRRGVVRGTSEAVVVDYWVARRAERSEAEHAEASRNILIALVGASFDAPARQAAAAAHARADEAHARLDRVKAAI